MLIDFGLQGMTAEYAEYAEPGLLAGLLSVPVSLLTLLRLTSAAPERVSPTPPNESALAIGLFSGRLGSVAVSF